MWNDRAVQLAVRQAFTWERTFSIDDVRRFGEISGDLGVHHVQPDADGRLMVQGLLTATLPTKIGGDLNFIAHTMSFEFLRPVFTGDRVRVDMVVLNVELDGERQWAELAITCRNQDGKDVLSGSVRGFTRLPPR
jgi:3-hydroxybutyryl-CoA dehydratase